VEIGGTVAECGGLLSHDRSGRPMADRSKQHQFAAPFALRSPRRRVAAIGVVARRSQVRPRPRATGLVTPSRRGRAVGPGGFAQRGVLAAHAGADVPPCSTQKVNDNSPANGIAALSGLAGALANHQLSRSYAELAARAPDPASLEPVGR
jgi:hypothetical protein